MTYMASSYIVLPMGTIKLGSIEILVHIHMYLCTIIYNVRKWYKCMKPWGFAGSNLISRSSLSRKGYYSYYYMLAIKCNFLHRQKGTKNSYQLNWIVPDFPQFCRGARSYSMYTVVFFFFYQLRSYPECICCCSCIMITCQLTGGKLGANK